MKSTECATLAGMARTHLDAVARAARDITAATDRRNAAMSEARASGETWADIATGAGMTPNGVRKALGFVRVSSLKTGSR